MDNKSEQKLVEEIMALIMNCNEILAKCLNLLRPPKPENGKEMHFCSIPMMVLS